MDHLVLVFLWPQAITKVAQCKFLTHSRLIVLHHVQEIVELNDIYS